MTGSPNEEQATYWNGARGQSWVQRAEQFDAQLEVYRDRAIEAADLRPGDVVLDIGCGAGATTLRAGDLVGADGRCIGLDISEPMIALARTRAATNGAANVEFVVGDAQTMTPPSVAATAVISRFGVMFFDDPTAAFTNIATMATPGARLSFVCWAPIEDNVWMLGPAIAVADLVAPPPPVPAGAPGPFAFADTERVRAILESTGWGDVAVEDIDDRIYIGGPGTVAEAVAFAMTSGPMSTSLATLEPVVAEQVRDRLLEALAPHHDGTGVLFDAKARLVRAVRV